MQCNKCGATLDQGDKFCINCGTKVSSKKPIQKKPQMQAKPKVINNNGVAAVAQQASSVAPANLYPAVGVFKFLLLQILMFIPIINIIALFAMSFSSKNNPNVRNYARAILLGFVIMIGVAYATGYATNIIELVKMYISELRP